VVRVPGSKSASNRALVLAALANAPSRITGLLNARDTRLMIGALESLGAHIDVTPSASEPGNVDVTVTPIDAAAPARDVVIDAGLAGTVMRFVPAIAALTQHSVRIDGDEQARVRPMGAIIEAVTQLGVGVDGTEHLPVTVHGTGSVTGGRIEIDASTSSQFVSALILIGARTADGLVIEHVGPALPSRPHIDMTVEMLREHGVQIDQPTENSWRISAGPIAALDRVIEPDLSNATPFLAAALVTKGRVHIPDWPMRTSQPGDAIRELLTQMGATVTLDDRGLTVSMDRAITGIDVDLGAAGELTPTVAALAALATSPSTISGVGHLRGHETNRIAALVHEIRHLGGVADERPDGLAIHPAMLHPGIFHAYADHRMATAGAILGLHVPGLSVDDIETTDKTLPDFPARWQAMLDGAHGA
jgi:3-phosphoshikimate 1-carboxyvinyltransferase